MLFLCQIPRRVIRLKGVDRRAFLQGLISNDIAQCQPGQAIFAALLTPQGKFLHDMFIVEAGEFFLIDGEATRIDDLLQRFNTHKLRAKIALENVSGEFDVWAAWKDRPEEIPEGYIYNDPRLPALGTRMIVKKGAVPTGECTTFDTYDRHRLELGVPDGSRDLIIEKSTLIEGNFDLLNGVSWTKGCYMGQELTARLHYRGLAKKRLYPVRIEGTAPVPGAPVTWDGEEIGEMRSSNGNRGLALLSLEKTEVATQSEKPFISGESRLTLKRVEWMEKTHENNAR